MTRKTSKARRVAQELGDRLEYVRTKIAPGSPSYAKLHRILTAGGDYGVGYQSVQNYHNGDRVAPADYLARIADAFDVNLWWLITGEGEPRVEDRVQPFEPVSPELRWWYRRMIQSGVSAAEIPLSVLFVFLNTRDALAKKAGRGEELSEADIEVCGEFLMDGVDQLAARLVGHTDMVFQGFDRERLRAGLTLIFEGIAQLLLESPWPGPSMDAIREIRARTDRVTEANGGAAKDADAMEDENAEA